MGNKVRNLFSWSYIALSLYAYFAETVQNFRGIDPRFVENGSAFDMTVGTLFATVAMLLIVLYLPFASYFFRAKTYRANPEMVLSARYAIIAILLSFAAGIWISMNTGRFTGSGGNIIWLHGLGFHALQAIPIVAWLTKSTALPLAIRQRYVHITGVLYIAGLLAIGWQTVLGQPILEWSMLPISAGLCFLVSFGSGMMTLRQALSGPQPTQARRM
ncbi:hypothetical protein FHS18_004313 [Paenibacillus phyllosphaerae]|uniref:DUF2306 domain-containing protein n=1 Tax=Paenibacillus phyllosphaerae TaxID=274593 RepID=A0A7W5FPH2_9BACL|nr:hypothetical protein [Paenibacillus phyllosphaerae]MBB3112227.1 hypothetical protein [Paenibacillus phyllosphaerae]